MKPTHREIQQLLKETSVVSSRHHPHLTRSLQWLESQSLLVRLLPTVYATPEVSRRRWARIRAVSLWDPSAIVTGHAAAYWSFWNDLPVSVVQVATTSPRHPQTGYAFSRRRVPTSLRLLASGVWITTPALTAIDLVPDVGGDAIDRALRMGVTDVPSLWKALEKLPNRRGNQLRRQMVVDSSDIPWSASERLLHRLLRNSDLRGWRTNATLEVDGETFCADVLFTVERVIVEVDGWEWHGKRSIDFRQTLRRHTTLEAAGWRVLHLSHHDLEHEPEWVLAKIRQTLTL